MATPESRELGHPQATERALNCADEFRLVCTDILSSLRARDPPSADDCSVGAQLLKIVDPNTGAAAQNNPYGPLRVRCGSRFESLSALAGLPLSDAQLVAEIGTFIMGGFETTGHPLA